MGQHLANLPSLVIANGASTTTTPITAGLDDADSITIQGPAALTNVVTVNISTDGGTTYSDLGSGGVDVVVTAGNSLNISPVAFNALKVTSSGNEGAARTFLVSKSFRV